MTDPYIWPPFCGEEFIAHDAKGQLVQMAIATGSMMVTLVCTKDYKHSAQEQHCNEETGFSWW